MSRVVTGYLIFISLLQFLFLSVSWPLQKAKYQGVPSPKPCSDCYFCLINFCLIIKQANNAGSIIYVLQVEDVCSYGGSSSQDAI